MQSADMLELSHDALVRRLDDSPLRSVLGKGQMRARPIVIVGVTRKDPPEMGRAQNDQVIQTLSANRANHAFGVWILPGRLRCSGNLINPKRPRLPVKRLTVDGVSISDQVLEHLVDPAGLKQLARRPHGCGMLGGVKVQDPSSVVGSG